MCQPGRPRPQGLSQEGSPGLAAFQTAKSMGSRFSSPGATRAPACMSSRLLRESLPYWGKARTEKYTSPEGVA